MFVFCFTNSCSNRCYLYSDMPLCEQEFLCLSPLLPSIKRRVRSM